MKKRVQRRWNDTDRGNGIEDYKNNTSGNKENKDR